MILIAIGQIIIYWFFALTRGSESEHFSNFCTVANCSILFFEYNNYGYYIHGKAPWGESDLPLSWLKHELDNETKGNQKTREFSDAKRHGLADKSNVITTYEIYVSSKFRELYDNRFKSSVVVADKNPNEGGPQDEDGSLVKKR